MELPNQIKPDNSIYRFIAYDSKDEKTWPKEDGTIVFRNTGEIGIGYYSKEPPEGEEPFFDEGDEWLCKVEAEQDEQIKMWRDVFIVCQDDRWWIDKLCEKYYLTPKQ